MVSITRRQSTVILLRGTGEGGQDSKQRERLWQGTSRLSACQDHPKGLLEPILLDPNSKPVIQEVWGGPENLYVRQVPGKCCSCWSWNHILRIIWVRSPALDLLWVCLWLYLSCVICLIFSCKTRGITIPMGLLWRITYVKLLTQCSGLIKHSTNVSPPYY